MTFASRTRAVVFGILDNAKTAGSYSEWFLASHAQLAEDMLAYAIELDGAQVSDLIPHIEAWFEARSKPTTTSKVICQRHKTEMLLRRISKGTYVYECIECC